MVLEVKHHTCEERLKETVTWQNRKERGDPIKMYKIVNPMEKLDKTCYH